MRCVFSSASSARLDLSSFDDVYLVPSSRVVVVVEEADGTILSQENGPKTLLYAHIFALDHLLGTLYTTFFAVVWYAWVPHDGRRVANSDAQKAMMGGAGTHEMDEATRTAAAMTVWEGERGFSAAVLVLGWVIKVRSAFLPFLLSPSPFPFPSAFSSAPCNRA